MTQREAILDMLRAAGTDGLCSWDCYRRYMPHVSSRIPELNAEGFVIEGETKAWPDGHGNHAHYFLVRERSALSSTAAFLDHVVDGSAVRAGGKSLGTASQPPTVTSGVPIHGETAAMRAQHSGPARPASYSPSREATTVIGIPARTVQQLTLAGGR